MPSWLRWDGVQLIMHKTARHLAGSGNRVLFCEPPYAISTIRLHPQHAERIRGDLRRWREGVRRVAPDLYVWTPPPVLLQMGIHAANDALNHRLLRFALGRAVRRLGMRRPIVWSYHPFYLPDEDFLSPRAVIFDCNDRIAAFEPRQEKRRLLDPMEAACLRRADRVFVTARTLEEDLRAIRPDIAYLPSGVDAAVVDAIATGELDAPADLAAIPAPRLGYVGAIDSRIDYELLSALVEADSAWQLVLIGPELEAAPEEAKSHPRIHFLGGREPGELAAYLAGFDLGLIPFRSAQFVRYMFPTKTYEYLAAGIPSVSTLIPALEELRPLVRVAADRADFVEQARQALAECGAEGEELRARRVAEARACVWEERYRRADGELAALLAAGGRPPSGPADRIELEAAALGRAGKRVAPGADRWGRPDPDRITILFLPCNLRIGGAERQLVDLAKGLDRARFRPLVCCFREVGPFYDELLQAAIPARFLNMRPHYDLRGLRAIWTVARILRRERVDIIQTYEFNTKLIGWLAARLARTPLIVSAEHATGEVGDTATKNRMLALLQRLCHRFIYVADAQRRFYETERGLHPHRSQVIYNGIDPERFDPGRADALPREEWGIPPRAPLVGITAVLRPEKAHELLLDAAPGILERVPAAHFLIVGDGPERARLEARSAELGLEGRVHFTGFRTDVERIVPLFDVAVLCSDPVVETFPLSLLEAMCCAKAVVATAVSGVPEIVEEGITGHLVPVRDAAALGERIASLLADPERARGYGAAGRARVLEHFTTAAMVERYDELYRGDLERRRPARAADPHHPDRVDVLGIGVDPVPLPELIDSALAFARGRARRIILYANVHVLDRGFFDPDLRGIINAADLVYVDGSGVRLAAALLGRWLPRRMTGADWIHDLCARAASEGTRLYFLAGRQGVTERAAGILREQHPGLQVVGTHHGYLSGDSAANQAALADIERARPDIVIVGMGTPVQERWIRDHRMRIAAPLVWGVGALFDFVTGEVRRGPRWLLDHHLEWAARLCVEPRRLWRRYLVGNPLFLARVLRQRLARPE